VVVFDRRGTGLSDKVSGERLPALDAKMDDIRAVMDAVGFDRAVLYGQEDGAAACLLFAATYPERTQAVITAGATASGLPSQDRPWAWTDEQWDDEIRSVDQLWGTRAYAVGLTQPGAGSRWKTPLRRTRVGPDVARMRPMRPEGVPGGLNRRPAVAWAFRVS